MILPKRFQNIMEINLSIQAVQDFLQKTSNIDEPVTIKQFGLSRKQSENSEKEQIPKSLAFHCIENNRIDILQILIGAGCSTNGLLQAAIESNKKEVFDFLILLDLDINSSNENYEAPLLVAVRKGILSYVEILLEKGANSAVFDSNGYSLIANAVATDNFDIAKLLIDNNSPISSIDFEVSPLHIAIEKRNIPAVFLLLQNGASTQLVSKNGDNYLKDSVKAKSLDIFKGLLACGATQEGINVNELPSDFASVYENWHAEPKEDSNSFAVSKSVEALSTEYDTMLRNIEEYKNEQESTNFEKNMITPIINKQNMLIANFTQFVKDLESSASYIQETRKELIKLNIDKISAEEIQILQNDFTDDESRWYKLFEESKTMVINNANVFDPSTVSLLDTQIQQFTKLRDEVFVAYNIHQDDNIKVKRCKLAYINLVLLRLNNIIISTLDILQKVFIPTITKTLDDASATLKSFRNSLVEVRQTSYDISLEDSNSPSNKKEKVEEICSYQCNKLQIDITFIDWQKEQFLTLCGAIQQCLRMSIH